MEAPPGFGALREYFRAYMRELGFAPSTLGSEWHRLFEDRTVPENQKVQKEFGRLLDGVKSALSERGYRVQDVSHKGKQAYFARATPLAPLLDADDDIIDRLRVETMDALDTLLGSVADARM